MKRTLLTCASSGIAREYYRKNKGKESFVLLCRKASTLASLGVLDTDIVIEGIDLSTDIELPFAKLAGVTLNKILLITPRPAVGNQPFLGAELWKSLLQTCYIGPLSILEQLEPYVSNPAAIVILSGISSVQIMPNHMHFGVIRTMWLAAAKNLSFVLGKNNVRVNTVSPGGVMTDALIEKMKASAERNEMSFEQYYKNAVENVPLGKYAKPIEVIETIQFLLSAEASHITGQNLVVDGGFSRFY